MLRFDDTTVLNIEYKREISDLNKIKKQLLRNKYYLEFLNKNMILVEYIQNVDKLYILQNEEIVELSKEDFIKILRDNSRCEEVNLNSLFKVSNYLISPFNKTKEFVEGKYFLTEQQEMINNSIFDGIRNGDKNEVNNDEGL